MANCVMYVKTRHIVHPKRFNSSSYKITKIERHKIPVKFIKQCFTKEKKRNRLNGKTLNMAAY